MPRRPLPQRSRHRGFALMALLVLLTLGGLYFFVNNLTPAAVAERRQQQTNASMNLARDALMGYALKYREDQVRDGQPAEVYGFFPLPDLGTTRNTNTGCTLEGCDAARFTGITFDATTGVGPTIVGRFPWRMLGTGPLKDGNGECLWYAVSASHSRIRKTPTAPSPPAMNWDTLSHLDIVVANGQTELASALANAHERPVVIIFSPGSALSSQNRTSPNPATDDVTECGGNYDVKNYLDPADGVSLGAVTNFFSGTTNSATGTTTALDAGLKQFSAQGNIQRDAASKLWPRECASGSCSTVGNDTGLTITGDSFFSTLRSSSVFRLDINSMLDRITSCLRDKINGGSTPSLVALAGVTSPTDKNIGRVPTDSCYNDTNNPLGYFSNYQDQLFMATRVASDFKVLVDGTENTCAAVLLFANQRSSAQRRTTTEVNAVQELNSPLNYLEGDNLTCFTTDNSGCFTAGGSPRFAGPSVFARVSGSQTVSQDIVRCVPNTANITLVAPTVAAFGGNIKLATYTPATSSLTLGSANAGSTNASTGSVLAESLSACAWTPETHATGSGLRSYFRFRIRRVGEGFTFAMVDGDRNTSAACGAARQHLGYSGNNGTAPYILPPKIAVEFDTSRNTGYTIPVTPGVSGNTLNNGRNDPDFTPPQANDAHTAIVYWGAGIANATVTDPQHDDNVHGFPSPAEPGARPAPINPTAVTLDRIQLTDASQREFHVRVELSASYNAPADPKDGATTVTTKMWAEPVSAKSISAITFTAGSPPTMTVTVTPISGSGHGLAVSDSVVIQDVVPAAYNGSYTVTSVVNSNTFTVDLPAATANPGRYISSITWSNTSGGRATVTSVNHGLSTNNTVLITGAVPSEYNGNWTITKIDNDSYRFARPIAGNFNPGAMAPGVAAVKTLTPNAIALANTTRAMSQLAPSFNPTLTDTATIYDEQKAACAVSIPFCPVGQSCGSDNMCYQPAFQKLRLGFTAGERSSSSGTSRSELVEITNQATTWLP